MTNRKLTLTLVAVSAAFLAGCAGQTDTSASTTASASSADAMKVQEQQRKLEMLQSELRNKERAIAAKEAELADLRTSGAASTAGASSASTGGNLFPPNPKPGECYARVMIPAQYNTTTETVLKREAAERIEVIPAKYGPGTERVLVKEASTKLELVPAVYDTVTERVMVTPPSKKIVEVPAKYKTVTERVLDKPAHTVWKRGTGQGAGSGSGVGYGGAAAQIERFAGQKVVDTKVDDTGEIMCLVEVPASYKTLSKQVLVQPARTDVVEIPARYETVTKTVMAKPPTTREMTIPAEYKTVKTTVLVEPAKERRIPIPAEYETVTKTVKVSDEQVAWRPVLCEVNMTSANVGQLQGALNKTGCCRCGPNRNECKVDGIMGRCTIEAARCYANQKGLPSGDKYITMEVIRSLGLKF